MCCTAYARQDMMVGRRRTLAAMASMLHHLQQPMFLLGQKELNDQLDCTTCRMADTAE